MTTADELRERFPVWKFAVGGSGELFRVPQNKQALCEPMVGPEFIRMDDAIAALTDRDQRIAQLQFAEDAEHRRAEYLESQCVELSQRAERAEADAERLAEALSNAVGMSERYDAAIDVALAAHRDHTSQ